MKQDIVSVSADAEKLQAVKRYMGKKEADLELELAVQLQRLYEKYVPANVREYIDENLEEPAPASQPRSHTKEAKS